MNIKQIVYSKRIADSQGMDMLAMMAECISRITKMQVSVTYNKVENWIEIVKDNYRYRIQFDEAGKFANGDVYKYSSEYEGFVHQKTYTDAYGFLNMIF